MLLRPGLAEKEPRSARAATAATAARGPSRRSRSSSSARRRESARADWLGRGSGAAGAARGSSVAAVAAAAPGCGKADADRLRAEKCMRRGKGGRSIVAGRAQQHLTLRSNSGAEVAAGRTWADTRLLSPPEVDVLGRDPLRRLRLPAPPEERMHLPRQLLLQGRRRVVHCHQVERTPAGDREIEPPKAAAAAGGASLPRRALRRLHWRAMARALRPSWMVGFIAFPCGHTADGRTGASGGRASTFVRDPAKALRPRKARSAAKAS